ncbi:MAG TPA: LuxR C-terminal-related transcriptional regulator, partial [Gaiellaceae bacterium]|nr:LuxR C-terminal-related transcriptional regulator [Gaiellaceae bacterium]
MPALRSRIEALGPAPPAALPDALSAREGEVLRLVARGLSNRDIGATLFISEHTAANHVRSILRKTGCSNRTEAAAYAISRGLAEAPPPT